MSIEQIPNKIFEQINIPTTYRFRKVNKKENKTAATKEIKI